MAWTIRLSVYVVFLIQTADQSLIEFASRWVDRWDHTIKKVKKKKKSTPTDNRTRLCNDNKNLFLKTVFKNSIIFTHLWGWEFIVRDRVHKLTVNQFLDIQSQAKGLSVLGFSILFSLLASYSLAQGNLRWRFWWPFSFFSTQLLSVPW